MVLVVRPAEDADVDGALMVWAAANVARGLSPSPARIKRVREKLTDPAAVVIVAIRDEELVGMLQAEPGRADDGVAVTELGHISMVFVSPAFQGQGVGVALLNDLGGIAVDRGWRRLSVWTRRTNIFARRLYEKTGFTLAGDTALLHETELVDRWHRDL